MKRKLERKCCYHCRHAGPRFPVGQGDYRLHCEHPSEAVAGSPGWDTVRKMSDGCPAFEPKPEKAE